jgi:hypothetical protein
VKVNPGRLEMGGMTYGEQYEAAEALRKLAHQQRLRKAAEERRRKKAAAKPGDAGR